MENKSVIMETVDYIESHLNDDECDELRLDEIANKISYSKFHLNRLFSEVVGCTIYKYIQKRRLTEAAKKLVLTDKPIIDIAYEANYESQQAFTLAFKQLYTHTPQEYRTIGIYASKQNRFTAFNELSTNPI